MITPGEEPSEDITQPSSVDYSTTCREFRFSYNADKVFSEGKEVGISAGRIISYTYNSMISLGFVDCEYSQEGREFEILWGTPGTRQMKIRAKAVRFPYNQDYVRNEKRDVSDIPVYGE